ncbi:GNAT family N-acetyltransferase [Streptomyces thermolilacinus SPC6]|uniref:GNAT family N-acetyltransferase n=1 Tax=Streptomyces thermolilacinus SPC6 TaxID=1306406 RepID=A0A1D3DZE0_9ACTN|nr:GNAT family N-acetyltransferase [Streptomyces thermolilacinus SPC6]
MARTDRRGTGGVLPHPAPPPERHAPDPEDADALAARPAGLGHPLPGVIAAHDTATAFAAAWQRHTGVTPTLHKRQRLCRLGTLTPPEPLPEGRSRVAGERDRDRLMAWHGEFAAAIGSSTPMDPGSWADARIASGRATFWETPDGTPLSMAGVSPMVAGQVRVAPVYTPAHLRGHGYAGAVTAEVSRAALAAGAAEVLLFADVATPTSNGLYRRVGYRPVTDFAVYDFPGRGARGAGRGARGAGRGARGAGRGARGGGRDGWTEEVGPGCGHGRGFARGPFV